METKIQFQHTHLNLTNIKHFENHVDILASYLFSGIELEHEYDPEPQLGNSVSLFDSMLTLVSLPHFKYFLKSALNPVPIHREIE